MTYQDVVNIIRDAANFVNPNGYFVHGRKSDGSLDYNQSTPHIILLEPQPNTSINNNSFFETTIFPIIFVTQDSPESTNVERENLKQEMYLLSRKLLSKIDEQPLLQQVQYTGGQPEIRQLSGTLTGFSYSLQVSYPLSECSLDLDLPPTIKLFATQTSVNAGSTIQIGWIAENVNTVNITPFGVLQGQFGFVNTVVNAETTYVGTATNSAGTATDSITIEIAGVCDDATAVIKDSLGNVLKTENIPSGTSEDITINNSVAIIKDTAGNVLLTEQILAEETEDIQVGNTTVQLRDSDGNNIGGVNSYLAQSNNNLSAPDGTVTVRNTTPTTLATQAVRSNGTATVTLNDITLTINDQNGNNLSTSSEKAGVNITKVVNVNTALALTIAASTTTPVTNQSINFTGGCTNGTPTNWRWDFGDGTSSTSQNPSKAYRYAGTYTVVLSATDGTNDGYVVFASSITVTLQTLFSTNLQQYNEAGIGATPSNMTLVSGAISQWNDSSSNGFNLTQGTATNRPTYLFPAIIANGISYGAAALDGTNDLLQNTSAGFTRATGSFEILFFRKKRLNTTEVYTEATTSNFYETFSLGNNSNIGLFNGSLSTNSLGFPINEYFILQVHWNGASSYVQINELSRYTIHNNIGTNSSVGSTIGATFAGSSNSLIDVVEHYVYSSKPSDTDITTIINRLKSKFGLW